MKIKAIIVALIMALALCAPAMAEAQPEQAFASARIGQEAPDFELELLSGETFRLSDCRGKVVFINIWATWCPPCVAEMPYIQALADAHPDDLVVIGVSCDYGLDEIVSFVEQNGYTYPIGWDESRVIGGLMYPSYYIPNSIFVDPNGIVTQMGFGGATYEVMEQNYLDALNHAAE